MASNIVTNRRSVQEIFDKMEYDNDVIENTDLANAWIEKQKNIFSTSPITTETIEIQSFICAANKLNIEVNKVNAENAQQFIKECKSGLDEWSKVKGLEKAKILNKISAEIEKNCSLICQLEMKVRDIFVRDTKTLTIPTLTDYFQYYCGWAASENKTSVNFKPYGTCVAYLTKTTPLAFLGTILAPCLAAGNAIILSVEENMIPICCLVRELAILSGVPKNTIQIVNGDLQIILKQDSIQKFTYIGDLFDDKFTTLEINDSINVNTLHLGKSNMLVFDSADLDSVSDSILEVAFNYRGYYPWTVDKIFVQESVYANLKNKISSKYNKLNIVENAAMKSGDVIRSSLPLLNFDSREAGSSIVKSVNANNLYILPFRTASEGISLVNNTRLGLATSVWTENMSLANEVVAKLKVGLIWFNSHGKIYGNTSWTPCKKSGKGYFGGKEGFFEYLQHQNKTEFTACKTEINPILNQLPGNLNSQMCLYYGGGFKKPESGLEFPNKKDVRNCVEVALKAHESWKKASSKDKAQLLRKFADNSSSVEKTILFWTNMLYEWSTLINSSSLNLGMSGIILSKEPIGVIAIEIYSNCLPQMLNFIIGAISSGNTVIILNMSDKQDLLKEICSKCCLPSGVFNVINCQSKDVIDNLKTHQEISAYFHASENKFVQMGSQHIMYNLKHINLDCHEDILKASTKNKIISFSIGESFM